MSGNLERWLCLKTLWNTSGGYQRGRGDQRPNACSYHTMAKTVLYLHDDSQCMGQFSITGQFTPTGRWRLQPWPQRRRFRPASPPLAPAPALQYVQRARPQALLP